MTFLPVVERELRVAARRRATYFVRLAAAAVGFVAAAWVLIIDRNSSQVAGGNLFSTLAVLLFIYAGVLGTQVTADCISEEKREGTLGLLFLTDLKGYDVVFGKLAATSIHWLYGMLAMVPMLAIPFLLGGVTQGELWRVVVVLLNLLFFSLSVGLFASTVCRKDLRAHVLAIVLVLVVVLAWPLASCFVKDTGPEANVGALFTPASGCFLAFDAAVPHQQQAYFWGNFAVTQCFSWTFLGLACWKVPRCWQDSAVIKNSLSRWSQSSSARSNRRTKLLEVNPFLWRASRSKFGSVAFWVALSITGCLWLWLYEELHRSAPGQNEFGPPVNIVFLVLGGLLIKLGVAVESGRAIGQDRRSGALELLLSTSLRPDAIVRGQQRALWRQFLIPILILLVANVFFLVNEWPEMKKWPLDDKDRLSVIWIHIVVGVFLVTDAIALSWVGMWHAFVGRNPVRASVPALFRVVLAPALLFWPLMFMLNASNAHPNRVDALVYWCGLGVGADILAVVSGRRLVAQFQTIASERYKRSWSIKPHRQFPANEVSDS